MFASKDLTFAKSSGAYQISRSLRFRQGGGNNAYLSRTFGGSPTSTTVYTTSFWMKRGALSAAMGLFGDNPSSNNGIIINSGNNLIVYGGGTAIITTTSVLRDPSAWYHVVWVCNGTSQTLYVNNVSVGTGTGTVSINGATQKNIGFYTGAYFDGYITEFNFIDGQALTPSSFGAYDGTTGVWGPKQYTGTYGTNGFYLPFTDNSGTSANDTTYSQDLTNAVWTKAGATATGNVTTAPDGSTTASKFTEDTTNAAHYYFQYFATGYQSVNVTWSFYVKAAGRNYALVELVTSAATAYAYLDLTTGTISGATSTGADFTNVSAAITNVGNGWYRVSLSATKGSNNTTLYPEFFLCSNSSYTSTYTGDGTSGMYIWGQQIQKSLNPGYYRATTSSALAAASNLGADQSNSASSWNFWTPNNISLTSGTTYDSMIDSPTNYADGGNGRGNYCVANPLYKPSTQSSMSIRYANLDVGQAATNTVCSIASTLFMSSGKWYWEVTVGAALTQAGLGIQKDTATAWRGTGTVLYLSGGNKQIDGATATTYGASYTTNNVIGFAYDADAGTLVCYKDNVSQGTIYSSGSGSNWTPCVHDDNAGVGVTYYHSLNFGQRPFTYTPPSGYSALNTQNLPTPTIKNGAQYMAATLYNGNGGTQSINNGTNNTIGTTFQPDFVWLKSRSSAFSNYLFDVIRGSASGLISNSTAAQDTGFSSQSFDANGFTVSTFNTSAVNAIGSTYVMWQWKAGGTGVTNTSGSITSTVSANTSSGFSVVTFTTPASGQFTVGHGLGVTPSLVIVKSRTTASSSWFVWHSSLSPSNTAYLVLNATSAAATFSTMWGSAGMTSTTIGLTVGGATYASDNEVAYCFAPVAGYSAFGSYTGNGSADGPFVYCGFRPRFVLIKQTTSASTTNWVIYDTSRDTYNASQYELWPNSSNGGLTYEATATSVPLDILSNGFKIRSSGADVNASSTATYIYMAVAENPFAYARAR